MDYETRCGMPRSCRKLGIILDTAYVAVGRLMPNTEFCNSVRFHVLLPYVSARWADSMRHLKSVHVPYCAKSQPDTCRFPTWPSTASTKLGYTAMSNEHFAVNVQVHSQCDLDPVRAICLSIVVLLTHAVERPHKM